MNIPPGAPRDPATGGYIDENGILHYNDDSGNERTMPWAGGKPDQNNGSPFQIRRTPGVDSFGTNKVPVSGYDPNKYYLGGSEGFARGYADRYGAMSQQADARAAPTTDYGLANETRGQQMFGLGMLRSAAFGGQPSAAASQYRMGMNQAGANAGAALAGGGSPLAMANAQRAGAFAVNQGMGSEGWQSSLARSAEDQRAIQAYTQGAMGMQGQDIGQAQYDADLLRRSGLLNDQRALALAQMESRANESQRDALMRGQSQLQEYQARMKEINDQVAAQKRAKAASDARTAYGATAGAIQAGVTMGA